MKPQTYAPMPCIAPRLVRRAKRIVDLLRQKKLSLVTAESCTADLIAAALSEADGASEVLEGAFVTYTKSQKTKALGIGARMLRMRTAVAPEVARAMVLGALKRSGADLAISATGVLGPEPDEDGNPVGLVYLCCGRRRGRARIMAKHYRRRSPDQLRRLVVLHALDLAENCLSGTARRLPKRRSAA
jgi:nicotinamide-nucleotide amidase